MYKRVNKYYLSHCRKENIYSEIITCEIHTWLGNNSKLDSITFGFAYFFSLFLKSIHIIRRFLVLFGKIKITPWKHQQLEQPVATTLNIGPHSGWASDWSEREKSWAGWLCNALKPNRTGWWIMNACSFSKFARAQFDEYLWSHKSWFIKTSEIWYDKFGKIIIE